jgi:hypothetical protein
MTSTFSSQPARRITLQGVTLHPSHPLSLLQQCPPTMRWRQMAKQRENRFVMIPLTRFSGQVIDRVRRFHVLNGHEIRSYAARFNR